MREGKRREKKGREERETLVRERSKEEEGGGRGRPFDLKAFSATFWGE